MKRDVLVAPTTAAMFAGGTNYLIQATNGALYLVYIDGTSTDIYMRKSTNGGITWSSQTSISGAIGTTQLAVWYGRWSGLADDKIYIAYTDSGTDDILFISVDTANSDALSPASPSVVYAGASTASGGALSIVVGRDGAIRVAGAIDDGAEDGAWSSVNSGATWTDAIADPSEASGYDQYMLLPGWNLDTADVQLIFWDVSANELSVKRYDDSANTWGETVIATSMADLASTTAFPNMAAFVDLTNSQNVVAAWSAVDSANADLRIWTINDTTITEMTNVVLNSGDDQGLVALGMDLTSGWWYCAYAGKSDGSETWNTAVAVYYKYSTDGGTTWSAEIRHSMDVENIRWLATCPRFTGQLPVCYYQANTLPEINMIVDINAPRVRH